MWFSRTALGFRGYFTLVDENGVLVPNKESGYFIVTTVSPDDTANVISTVSESSQKSGLYFFEVPTAFLLSHGVGNYAIVVEVDCDEATDAFSEVLVITQADFDSIQNLGNAILGNVV